MRSIFVDGVAINADTRLFNGRGIVAGIFAESSTSFRNASSRAALKLAIAFSCAAAVSVWAASIPSTDCSSCPGNTILVTTSAELEWLTVDDTSEPNFPVPLVVAVKATG